MLPDKYDSLQYMFACISTHSKWVKIIEDDFDRLSDYFHISSQDKIMLQNFFGASSHEMWLSAILLEEKRWREVLPSIKYTVTWVGLDELKVYWQHYLDDFSLTDNIPKSPITESIAFLNYLSRQLVSREAKAIVEYEILRNSVLSYEPDFFVEKIDIAIIQKDLRRYQCKINPSFIEKSFNLKISKIIEKLKNNSVDESFEATGYEIVGFYKQFSTGFVRSLQINEMSNKFLVSLDGSKNISDWLNKVIEITNTSQKQCVDFLEKMHKNGMIFITKVQ